MYKELLKDKIIAGSILGIVSNFPKMLLDIILYKMGFSEFFCWNVTAGVIISKEWIPTLDGRIIGVFMDFFSASILGILMIYFLFFFGEERYLFIKGVIFNTAAWLSICIWGIDQRISMYETLYDPRHAYQSFIDHTIWGVVMVYLILRYAQSTVVPSIWNKNKSNT